MSINLRLPESSDLKPKITVFGVGGAGGNAVNNMIASNLEGVEFVAANTDAQALALSKAERCIQMGAALTEGLGAGSRPEIGHGAAEESMAEIYDELMGTHMVFVTAGMGGGTGTGAAPVIARAAKEQGILTVGVVTKPFQFEGARRMRVAEAGIEELEKFVDTLIIIPNQNLFRVANEKTTFADAFGMADEVLHSGVRGVTDLMVMPGLINLDFADVRTVMSEMGKAMMGTGEAEGEKRALEAAEAAISNPLLDEISMKGARGVLINITGGMDLTLFEVDEAANRIRAEVDPEANIIVGSTFNEGLDGQMRVSVVATGIALENELKKPVGTEQRTVLKRPERPAWRSEPRPAGSAASAAVTAVAKPVVEENPVLPEEPASVLTTDEVQHQASQTNAEVEAAETKEAMSAKELVDIAENFANQSREKPVETLVEKTVPTLELSEKVSEVELSVLVEKPEPTTQRPRRKRAGILGRMRESGERMMFGTPEARDEKTGRLADAPTARQHPARVKQTQEPAGLQDAPKVKVDPSERLVQTDFQEEQLEIPAFLRRPSN